MTDGRGSAAQTEKPVERRQRSRPEGGTKPLDKAYLARFTLGNTALEREVLDLFLQHVPCYADALRQASTAKAWHDAAHTLKGAARGVGAWRIARCAEMAERLRFDTDIDRRAFAIDSITESVDEAIGYIHARQKAGGQAAGG
jgi:HPt (histidine-containing phosphotransfer) domain-containing protein